MLRSIDELGVNKDRYKSLADEMDSTFAELAGYQEKLPTFLRTALTLYRIKYLYNTKKTPRKRFDLELFLVVPLQKQCTKRSHHQHHHHHRQIVAAKNEELQRDIEMNAPKLLFKKKTEIRTSDPFFSIVSRASSLRIHVLSLGKYQAVIYRII